MDNDFGKTTFTKGHDPSATLLHGTKMYLSH